MALFIRENEMPEPTDKQTEIPVGVVQGANDDIQKIEDGIKKVVRDGVNSNVLSGMSKIVKAITSTLDNNVSNDSKNTDAGPKGP